MLCISAPIVQSRGSKSSPDPVPLAVLKAKINRIVGISKFNPGVGRAVRNTLILYMRVEGHHITLPTTVGQRAGDPNGHSALHSPFTTSLQIVELPSTVSPVLQVMATYGVRCVGIDLEFTLPKIRPVDARKNARSINKLQIIQRLEFVFIQYHNRAGTGGTCEYQDQRLQ